MSMEKRFRSDGALEPLAFRLNRTLTWQDVYNGQDDNAQRSSIKAVLGKYGIDEATGRGRPRYGQYLRQRQDSGSRLGRIRKSNARGGACLSRGSERRDRFSGFS